MAKATLAKPITTVMMLTVFFISLRRELLGQAIASKVPTSKSVNGWRPLSTLRLFPRARRRARLWKSCPGRARRLSDGAYDEYASDCRREPRRQPERKIRSRRRDPWAWPPARQDRHCNYWLRRHHRGHPEVSRES